MLGRNPKDDIFAHPLKVNTMSKFAFPKQPRDLFVWMSYSSLNPGELDTDYTYDRRGIPAHIH